ncbi:MAG: CoA-binding protein [Spirochaetales bacterium]|nr:MAG: CoA-binding protein [Spirochaetales bacterium]
MKTVVIVGASTKKDRYSYKALNLLTKQGYRVIPVHPAHSVIAGIPVVRSCRDIKEPVHTVTLYVNREHLEQQLSDILALQPERIIFNPGAESDTAWKIFTDAGIHCLRACTILLLTTGQFDKA